MSRKNISQGLKVRMRGKGKNRESVEVFSITAFSPPIIELGGYAIKSDIDWERSRELWSNVQAPLGKLEMVYDFLKHGMAIEFVKPTGNMITYVISDEIKRYNSDELFRRYYICFHCSVVQFDLGNGYQNKQQLENHINSIHRYQPILVYRCSSCTKRFEFKSELLAHKNDTSGDCSDTTQPDELLIPSTKLDGTTELQPYWQYVKIEIVHPYEDIPTIPTNMIHQNQADSWLEKVRLMIRKNAYSQPAYQWAEQYWVPQHKPTKDEKEKFNQLVNKGFGDVIFLSSHIMSRPILFDLAIKPLYCETVYWDKHEKTILPTPNCPNNAQLQYSESIVLTSKDVIVVPSNDDQDEDTVENAPDFLQKENDREIPIVNAPNTSSIGAEGSHESSKKRKIITSSRNRNAKDVSCKNKKVGKRGKSDKKGEGIIHCVPERSVPGTEGQVEDSPCLVDVEGVSREEGVKL